MALAVQLVVDSFLKREGAEAAADTRCRRAMGFSTPEEPARHQHAIAPAECYRYAGEQQKSSNEEPQPDSLTGSLDLRSPAPDCQRRNVL